MTAPASALLTVLLLASVAHAQSGRGTTPSAPLFSESKGFQGSDGVKKLRARLGLLGGLHMQKTDLALGVSYDLLPVLERPLPLIIAADFTLGLRPREFTVIPAVLVRAPLRLQRAPKLEPYVQAGLGVNLTFMRGGTAMSMPFRIGVGGHYELAERIGIGMQLDAEVGPLLAPFADSYSALHFGVVFAYAL